MKKPDKSSLEVERKIIHLMLKSRDVIEELFNDGISSDYFDAHHDFLIRCIYSEYINSGKKRLLTRQAYQHILVNENVSGDLVQNLSVYDKCFIMAYAKPDELGYLKKSLVDGFLYRAIYNMMDTFNSEHKTKGALSAAHGLSDVLQKTLGIADTSRTDFVSLSEMKDDVLQDLSNRKSNPEKVIRCHVFPEIDDVINVGFRPQHLTLFVADVGSHKCVKNDSKIYLEDGGYITAEQLYRLRDGQRQRLLSLNSLHKIYKQPYICVLSNGVKECFRIKTRLGNVLEVTSNHPLLTLNGYVRLEELNVGDFVGIARKMPFGSVEVTDEEAIWVGCMYTDGGTTQPTYTFANLDNKIVCAMHKATISLGGNFKEKRNRGKIVKGNFLVNGLQDIGRRYGLHGKRSIEKILPSYIYTWNRKSMQLLLQSMFGCDGCVYISGNGHVRIVYSSSSYYLASDVRNLLLKFGIVATLSEMQVKYKGEKRASWQVKISDAEQVSQFIKEIGFLGCKSDVCKNCIDLVESRKYNRNIDLIPPAIWEILEKKFQDYGKSHYQCRRFLKTGDNRRGNEGHCGTKKRSMNRYLLQKIAGYLGDNELSSIAESDVSWDEIISIESIGNHETYDISMKRDPNFVVDNFITHNTNLMLNIALALYDRGTSVLFVPLEMSKMDLVQRIVANRAKINYNKLARPEMLSDEEWQRIRDCNIWTENQHRFCILDCGDRISVSRLKAEIEKRSLAFSPQVVIIDYIANIEPDRKFGGRNDLEIGEILKSLRFLGKKHGFHIISAAQMGRQAIKSLKESNNYALDSTVIRGSHEYSADSDTIFGLLKVNDEPDKLKIVAIKSRHGSGGTSKMLHVQPEYCLITSTQNMHTLTNSSDEDIMGLESDLNTPIENITSSINFAAADFDEL